MNKKKFIKLAGNVENIKNIALSFGQILFGCLGFMFGAMALMIIISQSGNEIPYFFNMLFYSFGSWMAITVFLGFVHIAMLLIANNPKNWRKQ